MTRGGGEGRGGEGRGGEGGEGRGGACIYMLMRDAEGRKKEASKVIKTTKPSNTTCTLYFITLTHIHSCAWIENM